VSASCLLSALRGESLTHFGSLWGKSQITFLECSQPTDTPQCALKLGDQARQTTAGQCKRECQTVAKGCVQLIEDLDDTDTLQVQLWRGVQLDQLETKLCSEWTNACTKVRTDCIMVIHKRVSKPSHFRSRQENDKIHI